MEFLMEKPLFKWGFPVINFLLQYFIDSLTLRMQKKDREEDNGFKHGNM